MENQTPERCAVTLPDGGTLKILVAGPADGLPLVLHGGTPSALSLYPSVLAAASVRGLRVIGMARPGYEVSTARPGRRVVDVAGDVAAVLTAVGADTFVTVGWSGGGPHALACAAALRGQWPAAACGQAGVGALPRRRAWTGCAGMRWRTSPNSTPTLAVEDGAVATSGHGGTATSSQTASGPPIVAAFGALASPADQAAMTGEYADFIAADLRASVSTGIAGWRDDDLAFVSDWGFSLGWGVVVRAAAAGSDRPVSPVAIWQGDQDRMVPYPHGEWLATHIPKARAHLLPGEGHLTLTVAAIDRILDDLLDLADLSR